MPTGVRAFSISGSDAGADEDALTLAIDAAVPLAETHRADGGAISGVVLAAGTGSSRLLAEACDVPFERLRTTELRGPRAALQGVLAACERLLADRESADVLVAAGDHAGGAALVLGRGSLAAELLGWHSVTGEDVVAISRAAIAGALTNANAQIRDVARFAIGAPSVELARRLLEVCGADPAKQALMFGTRDFGLAQPLLSFAAALEASKPDDLVVVSAWGDGADALVFRVRAAAPKSARAIAPLLGQRPFREPLDAPAEPEPLRWRGARCRHCDALRHPATPLCSACGKEGADSTRLPRTGVVRDASTVELDGGLRVARAFTTKLAPGESVELCVRRAGNGYAWKARPA